MNQVSPMDERYRVLKGFQRWITIIFSLAAIILAVYQIFHLRLFDIMIMDNSYLYLLLALYLSLSFLLFPPKKGASAKIFFWFDSFLFLLSLGIPIFFAWHGYKIIEKGWGYLAPPDILVMAVILWFLVLEAVRRTQGLTLAIILFVFSLYPLFAPHMPGFLEGYGRSFITTATFHSLSVDSILGIPLRVFGELLIGFMLFGVALQASGGGKFFLNLSFALLGGTRGGPAKVAVLASALFGTMSGSAISNVITTGSITIPAMKRIGYPPHYAGAIESCASTGGVLMPPVMGATAFVMAAFLQLPYAQIAIAAAIPSILYYLGLLIQVDGFAAKKGFPGIPRSEIQPLKKTLKEGWFYLLSLIVLMYFLFSLRVESQAPFYAIAILLAAAMIRKETRFTLDSLLQFIQSTGKFLAELLAILAGVGMIMGSLALTGVAASFSRELVALAGGNIAFMLILGALTSFILGMGMTITACYVFLALVLAPGLVAQGLNALAVHLFVMYWGMISFITPPVALAAFAAATIAQTSPIKVGYTACRLGGVIYILPFIFVFNPALILQAGIGEILQTVSSATLGVILIASSFEGYLLGIGRLNWGFRIAFLIAGIALAIPEWKTDLLGLAIALATFLLARLGRRKTAPGIEI
ncbi:MAG: TRAP transporter fused permease subunit [Deltaproteobacteria bacterium]|nr:TRAP transporter fused permease subunit [Deltaproteobacteria bacterium]